MIEKKYAIIGGEIHQLIRIHKKSEWHLWRIHEKDNLYWIPVEYFKRKPPKIESRCPNCKRKYPWNEGIKREG